MRRRECIDRDWRFSLGDVPAASAPAFEDRSWRTVDVPHDWSIEATPHPDNPSGAAGGFFPGGVGWYRKLIDIPAALGDRRVFIEFDGVYMNSEVWCNGHSLGERPYGYSSFCYDLTPHVTAGKPAVIAVRADNSRQKNSRWYSGSGIYRHVWLTLAGPVHVAHWGVFVATADVTAGNGAAVDVHVEVVNERGKETQLDLRATVLGPAPVDGNRTGGDSGPALGERILSTRFGCGVPCPPAAPDTVRAGIDPGHEASGVAQDTRGQVSGTRLVIPKPCLWSPESPRLYTLRIELMQDGQVIDMYDTRFGIRTLRFDADEGFFLNGVPTKFKGVNEHHDAGCLGAAVPDDVIRRRFRILKKMGCNAIRVAHNPASPAFLDLCDEMGFLVVEEAFDEWKDGKTPYGYGGYWDAWWERDLVDMIRRDRNHPCIVMWSVGNEIKEVREGRPEGLPIMQALRDVCHREDPMRPMTCGCCNTRKTLAAGFGSLMDVVGYNGGGGSCFDYEKDHAAYPKMILFASEVPHTLQTRGVYRTRTWYRDLAKNPDVERRHVPHFTREEVFTDFDPHYQSSYDNAMVRISAIDSWRLSRTLPFLCGEFRWTGFDYLGECYAWPCKSWNFGVIDLCGFPKDTYYFYQSQWTEKLMVHLLPHWTWPGLEGKIIPVICYTNCDRAEVFLNGKSLGVKKRDDKALYLRWDVPYRPSELKAVGWQGDAEAATCVHETAGAPLALKLSCDELTIRADRTGIAHVVVTVVDEKGRMVPHAGHDITIDVEGPGRLIGLENGDPMDTTNYRLGRRRAFHGMLLAIVRAGDEPGTVTVRASAEGLRLASCAVRSAP